VYVIIAALIVGALLLWGGILGLLRIVDLFESKHILGLGAYVTLISGLVMGLVLFTANERQKEQRLELRLQMKSVTTRLGDLSQKLVGQLEEKVNLTESEFSIRARLQNEQADHTRTRDALALKTAEGEQLQSSLNKERQQRLTYQTEQNRKMERRFLKDDERYQGLNTLLQGQSRNIQGVQKQLSTLQDGLSGLKSETSGLVSRQNSMMGKINATREVQDLNAQRVDALSRSQAALYDDLSRTMAKVDSLYKWKKK
jgi:chromosome segregation ATPase